MRHTPNSLAAAAFAALTLLSACGGGGDDSVPAPEETRTQDERKGVPVAFTTASVYPDYQADASGNSSFTPLPGAPESDRYAGIHNGAAYRIEVPKNWNGQLVMYAHGYRGTHETLTVSNPSIRRYLIDNGYAWAASSYSKNWYDVRAGVEDTNALALAFNSIAASKGRTLTAPTKTFITGHSMGGHVAAAAVEQEALDHANNKIRYAGAVPMCGVTGDLALYDTFTAMQVTAQAVAGVPAYPLERWTDISALVNNTLWGSPTVSSTFTPTAGAGERYASIIENLTGGQRPLFRLALTRPGSSFASAYGTFGRDGTVNGILNKNGPDTTRFTYTITGDEAASQAINAAAIDVVGDPEANRLRRDGLRWFPKINGEFSVPVVSMHTLGDLFVPFRMMQTHRERAQAKGNGDRLVTRAVRGIGHCDFTVQEQVEAFDAMIKWEKAGGTAATRPAGDDVLSPSVVAQPTYGCQFTRAPVPTVDSTGVINARNLIVAQGGACPAP